MSGASIPTEVRTDSFQERRPVNKEHRRQRRSQMHPLVGDLLRYVLDQIFPA
jgi:hypothetical protein